MGTQGTGRKRSIKKDRSTAEDDALNLIAKEAEARLAAKRAARAEAREIRMKELERQQKELSDEDERMSVGSRGSVKQVEDRDSVEKGSRTASALTAATLTSLGGTSSRRGSGETALTLDAESSLREIKEIHELKDQIQDVESKYTQNLKEAKDALVEVEEKYRKAMVSNAQLDNEKNNLMYQVDTLKDSLMELEELLSESHREYEDKAKEFEREKHAHGVLQFQFNEIKETLKQSEELLNEIRQLRLKQDGFVREISDLQETVEWKDKKIGALERQKEYTDAIRIERDELREEVVTLKDILKKHGIVLGPDLNINGDASQKEPDLTAGADPSSLVQESQKGPQEGNSVLGNSEETELRTVREEELDPEQNQEIDKETKESHLIFDSMGDIPDGSPPQKPNEKQLTDQKMSFSVSQDSLEVCHFRKNRNIEEAETQNSNVYTTETQESASNIESKDELLEEPDLKESKMNIETNNILEVSQKLLEKQDKHKEEKERNLMNADNCHQQITHAVPNEGLSHESFKMLSNNNEQEPKRTEEAKNEEAEKMPSTSVKEKKKKRKKRGKRKGPEPNETTELQKTQKEETTKEGIEAKEKIVDSTDKTSVNTPARESFEENQVALCTFESKQSVEPEVQVVLLQDATMVFVDEEPLHTDIKIDQVSNEHEKHPSMETTMVDLKDTEMLAFNKNTNCMEILGGLQIYHGVNAVNNAQPLENVQPVAQMETSESSYVETLQETEMDAKKDEKDVKWDEMRAVMSLDPEGDTQTSDIHVSDGESSQSFNKDISSSVNNSLEDIAANIIKAESENVDQGENKVEAVNALPYYKSSKLKNELGISDKDETQTFVPSSEVLSAHVSESKHSRMVPSQMFIENLTDAIESLPDTCAAMDLTNVHPTVNESGSVEVFNTISERKTMGETDFRTVKPEFNQELFAPSVKSTSDGEDGTELKENGTEEELCNDVAISTNLNEPNNTSDENTESFAKTSVKNTDMSVVSQCVQLSQHLEDTVSLSVDQRDLKAELEMEKVDVTDLLTTPYSTKDSIEVSSSVRQEMAIAEHQQFDERKLSAISAEGVQEATIDKSKTTDSSQPTLIDGDDEEGQSFDFDDMDVEAVLPFDLSKKSDKEEIEEGVEVMSDENKMTLRDSKVADTETDMLLQEDMVSSVHKAATSNATAKNVPEVADQPLNVSDKGNDFSFEALGAFAHNLKETMSTQVEEALDVVKLDWQGDSSDSPKSQDQLTSSKEPSQSGRYGKKSSNKSKGKGKEDCKMS